MASVEMNLDHIKCRLKRAREMAAQVEKSYEAHPGLRHVMERHLAKADVPGMFKAMADYATKAKGIDPDLVNFFVIAAAYTEFLIAGGKHHA